MLTAIISKTTVNCFSGYIFSLQDEATMSARKCVVSGRILVCIRRTSKEIPPPGSN